MNIILLVINCIIAVVCAALLPFCYVQMIRSIFPVWLTLNEEGIVVRKLSRGYFYKCIGVLIVSSILLVFTLNNITFPADKFLDVFWYDPVLKFSVSTLKIGIISSFVLLSIGMFVPNDIDSWKNPQVDGGTVNNFPLRLGSSLMLICGGLMILWNGFLGVLAYVTFPLFN